MVWAAVAVGRAVVLGRVVAVLGRVEVPVLGRVDVLVLGRVDVPALGRVDVLVLGRVDVPVLGRVDVLVLGRVDVPVFGRVEEVVPRDPDEPVPVLGREVVAGRDGALLVFCPVEPCCCGGAAPLFFSWFFSCAHMSTGTSSRTASKALRGNLPARRTHLITSSSIIVWDCTGQKYCTPNFRKPAARR